MSVGVRNLRLGVRVAALAGALTLASAGPAVAAKFVTSDTISFKTGYAGEPAGVWDISGSPPLPCKVKSDGEATAFDCALTGEARGIGSPEIEGTTEDASSDGQFFVGFKAARTATSKPPNETYVGSTPSSSGCIEGEETEPGSGKGIANIPCVAKVRLTFNTVKKIVTGSYVIREESTQP